MFQENTRFLRFSLLGNALFSAVSGGLMLGWNRSLVAWLGLPDSISLFPSGIALLVFALTVAWIGLRKDVSPPPVQAVIFADLGWVIGSAFLIGTGFFGALGIPVAGLTAALVFLFASLQYYGLRKVATPIRPVRFFLLTIVALISFGFLLKATAQERLMDLRNPYLRQEGQDPDATKEGRRLLMESAGMHGIESWKQYRVQELTARDLWLNARFSWWADRNQEFGSKSLLGTFTSRLELLDGREKGKILGIQSWDGYTQETSGGDVVSSDEGRILFYLPTLQYFHELPFRLISAPLISYAGQAHHRGKLYDLVFVTWGSWQANEKYDQYMLWIDPVTKLIKMAHYTVREAFPSASGTIHFDDYRKVQGVHTAYEQTVVVGGPSNTRYPLKEHYFHRLETKSVAFRADVPKELTPLKGIREIGDRKP